MVLAFACGDSWSGWGAGARCGGARGRVPPVPETAFLTLPGSPAANHNGDKTQRAPFWVMERFYGRVGAAGQLAGAAADQAQELEKSSQRLAARLQRVAEGLRNKPDAMPVPPWERDSAGDALSAAQLLGRAVAEARAAADAAVHAASASASAAGAVHDGHGPLAEAWQLSQRGGLLPEFLAQAEVVQLPPTLVTPWSGAGGHPRGLWCQEICKDLPAPKAQAGAKSAAAM